MKKLIVSAFVAAAILSGCRPETKEELDGPVYPETTEAEGFGLYGDEQIKIMSFNVKVDNGADPDKDNSWEKRKEACVFMINEQRPTVIGLQEAHLKPQFKWLKTALQDNYDGFGVERNKGTEDGSGEVMGVLYDKNQVENLDWGTFWLSETPEKAGSKGWDAGYPRTATWGLFVHKKTGVKFCFINTHLDNEGANAKINGISLIKERFEMYDPEGSLRILTGDFNSTIDKVEVFGQLEETMQNTRLTAPADRTDTLTTLNSWTFTKQRIIDHIYVSKDVEVVEYKTIQNRYGNIDFISDHYPIVSVIKIK